MSQRSQDIIGKMLEKPRAKARYEAAQAAHKAAKRRKKAMDTLTRGGILIPKPHVMRESLEELRETGHAYADQIEKMLKRIK